MSTVSLRAVIDAPKKRLDELGTARWIEEAADLVHKTQAQGQPIGKLSPDAISIRGGKVALDVPASISTAYSAPERLRGSTGDRRSDVFSLGVILWEALAHVPLFEGANDDAVKAAVLDGEIRPVSEMNANVPAELDAICQKALARDPANRYQSAKVMAAEISAVLDDAGYPEGTDTIAKWIASEFPDGGAAAVPLPVATPAPAPAPVKPVALMSQTVMGIAPLVVPASQPTPQPPVVAELRGAKIADALSRAKSDSAPPEKPIKSITPVTDRTEPLMATDIEVIALDNPTVIPLDTKKAIVDPKPLPSDTLRDVKSGFEPEAKPPSALTKGWDIPEAPAADKRAGESKPPVSSLPSWATRPSGNTQPPPVAAPVAPVLPSLSTTLSGTTAPVVAPSILTSAPQTSSPALKLPDAPPGATISADKPSMFSGSTTAVVGSSISTAVAAVPAAAPFQANRTAVLGSNAIIEATNAAVSAANPPATAIVLPSSIVGTPAVKLSEAETVGTPIVPAFPLVSASPTPPADLRAVKWDASKPDSGHILKPPTLPPPIADRTPAKVAPKAHALPPPAADDFAAPTGQGAAARPAATASASTSSPTLPRTRGNRTGTGSRDVLAGWGVGTDSHEALGGDDDVYEEDRQKAKKRLVMILGGAVAAVVVVVVVALAAGGGSKDDKEAVAKKPTEPAVQPAPEPAPPKPEPPKPEPANVEPPKPAVEPPKPEPEPAHEPTLAKAELPKPEPDKVEPPKPEPPKPEIVKPAGPPQEAPKIAKKPEVVAKKPEPKKPEVKKPEPKKPEVVAIKKPEPKLVDPYDKKVDAPTAYKAGFQKFVKGDSLGALESFKSALASDATFAPTWRGIGLVYEKLGRRSQAVTAFKRYLQLAPNAGDADQIRSRLEKLGS